MSISKANHKGHNMQISDFLGYRANYIGTSITGKITKLSTPGFVILTTDKGLNLPVAFSALDLVY